MVPNIGNVYIITKHYSEFLYVIYIILLNLMNKHEEISVSCNIYYVRVTHSSSQKFSVNCQTTDINWQLSTFVYNHIYFFIVYSILYFVLTH